MAFIFIVYNHYMKWKLIVLSVSVIVAIFVRHLYIPLANINWDEAAFLSWTYNTFQDLKEGNFTNFLKATREQLYYPPLQPWSFYPFIYLFGFSIEKARVYGLIWFVLGSFLIFLLGRHLSTKYSNFVGLMSSLLFLSSPMTLLLSSMAVKETMGVALSLLTFYLYFRARERKKVWEYLLVSLALTALTLTKYNFGVYIGIALFLEGIVAVVFLKKKLFELLSHGLIFLPFSCFFIFWFSWKSYKISDFFHFLSPVWSGTAGLTDFWGYNLFYPRAIVFMYAPSVVAGMLLLITPVVALFYFHNHRVRLLWFAVIINLILGRLYSQNMQERYIFIVVPFLFVLAAFFLGKIFEGVYLQRKKAKFWGIVLGISILLGGRLVYDLWRLPHFVYSLGAYTLKTPLFNQTDYQDLWFDYNLDHWPKKLPFASYEKPADVVDYISSSLDLSKNLYIVGGSNEFSPPYFGLIQAINKKAKQYPSMPYDTFVVTIETFPSSRFYTRDYLLVNSWQIEGIRKAEKDPALTLIKKKKFEQLGVEVVVYGKK